MDTTHIALQRLYAQRISHPEFQNPGEVVRWLGAIQAQDNASAEWSIGVRAPGVTQAAIERAVVDRTIVRTWALRGTLHVVSAADVHWLLDLLAPTLRVRYAPIYRQVGLDEEMLVKRYAIMTTVLQGGTQLTRKELSAAFEHAGMPLENRQASILLNRAALDKIICLGATRGKQPTYTLLDEWVPQTTAFVRDEALAELASRYFTSHGPATLQDFVWWTGLAVTDARAGLEAAKSQLIEEKVEGRSYWFSPSELPVQGSLSTAYLLPGFDEFILGYTDRTASLDAEHTKAVLGVNGIFAYPWF